MKLWHISSFFRVQARIQNDKNIVMIRDAKIKKVDVWVKLIISRERDEGWMDS